MVKESEFSKLINKSKKIDLKLLDIQEEIKKNLDMLMIYGDDEEIKKIYKKRINYYKKKFLKTELIKIECIKKVRNFKEVK